MTTAIPSSELEREEMRAIRLLLLLIKRSGDKKVQWREAKRGNMVETRGCWLGASEDMCPICGQVEGYILVNIG